MGQLKKLMENDMANQLTVENEQSDMSVEEAHNQEMVDLVSEKEIVEKLNNESLSGVFHCFTGNIQEAERIINLENFYLGIGGVVTFKNGGINKIINQISLDNIILETDSPYLTPTPFRGKRNESKYLVNIAQKMSEIYEIDINEIANKTSSNAINLFKI